MARLRQGLAAQALALALPGLVRLEQGRLGLALLALLVRGLGRRVVPRELRGLV